MGRESDRPGSDPLPLLLIVGAIAGAVIVPALTAAPYANPDSHAFEALARSLVAGHGLVYREPMMPGLDLKAFRSPGYAAFLALAMSVGGIPAALVIQGALAGATAAFSASIVHGLAGRRAGFIAFAAALCWFEPWRFAGELMTETLYTFLAVVAIWIALKIVRARAPSEAPRLSHAIPLGLVAVAAALTRPRGFGLLAALCAWAPWPIRNARALGTFVPSLSSGGLNAWNGNTGQPIHDGWILQSRHADLGEIGLDRMFWRLTIDDLEAHPTQVAQRIARKAVDCGLPSAFDRWQGVLALLWPLAVLGVVVGLWTNVPWKYGVSLIGLAWAAHVTLSVLTVGGGRYRFPTEPFVLILGTLGIETLMRRYGAFKGTAASIGLATLATIGFAFLHKVL
jgi:hypothetical protein